MPGPLAPTGTTWLCATTAGTAVTKTGRYLTVELRATGMSRLALAEVAIVARGEWLCPGSWLSLLVTPLHAYITAHRVPMMPLSPLMIMRINASDTTGTLHPCAVKPAASRSSWLEAAPSPGAEAI